MSDTHIEVHGVRFAVQHRGFDDRPMDLHAGLAEVDRILTNLPKPRVLEIHKAALHADETLEGTGVTLEISKLEKIAFEKATKNWVSKEDSYLWLRAV